jgi:hypothetical protein
MKFYRSVKEYATLKKIIKWRYIEGLTCSTDKYREKWSSQINRVNTGKVPKLALHYIYIYFFFFLFKRHLESFADLWPTLMGFSIYI